MPFFNNLLVAFFLSFASPATQPKRGTPAIIGNALTGKRRLRMQMSSIGFMQHEAYRFTFAKGTSSGIYRKYPARRFELETGHREAVLRGVGNLPTS